MYMYCTLCGEGLTKLLRSTYACLDSICDNLHGIKWVMFHGHLDYFQNPPLGGRLKRKPRDHGSLNAHNRRLIILYHVGGPA